MTKNQPQILKPKAEIIINPSPLVSFVQHREGRALCYIAILSDPLLSDPA
jgi:hypothetical protein